MAGADYWNKGALRRFVGGKVFRAVLIDRAGRVSGLYRKVYIPREEMEGGITPDQLVLAVMKSVTGSIISATEAVASMP